MPSTSQLTSNSRSMNGLNTINANAVFTDTLEVNTLTIDTAGTVPTRPNGDNTTNIANTQFVTNAVTTAGANYVDLTSTQTIMGEKTFSNANTLITGKLQNQQIEPPASNNTTLIHTNQVAGIMNIGTAATRSGAININTGSTSTAPVNISTASSTGTVITIGSTSGGTTTLNCGTLNLSGTAQSRLGANMTGGTITVGGGAGSATTINIGSTQTNVTSAINIGTVVTGNAPITIGSTASTTQTATHNAITTFTQIPSCSVVPTTANHLCNKTYVDSVAGGGVNLGDYNVWTNENDFTNLVKFQDPTLASYAGIDFFSSITPGIVMNAAPGTTSALSGVNLNTNTLTVPIKNNQSLIRIRIPMNIAGFGVPSFYFGQLDIIFNSITAITILKNGSFYRNVSVFDLLNFTGTTKSWTGWAYKGENARAYVGDVQFELPITTANTSVDTYTIGITMDVAVNAGAVGLITPRFLCNGDFNFTTTHAQSVVGPTYISTDPASFFPFQINYGNSGNYIIGKGDTYVKTIQGGRFTIDAQSDIEVKSPGDIDILASGTGSININATTTNVSGTTYINTSGTNDTAIGQQSGGVVSIRSPNVLINTAGTVNTNIGNTLSTTYLNGTTVQDINSTFNMMPTATIIQNVSATVPAGFLFCDGQAVNRVGIYARLFASIGTTFGVGNGTTTFNVPNFQGAVLKGINSQTSGGVTYSGAALGTAQADAVQTPLYASNQGFRGAAAGTRECVARAIIVTDPTDITTGILPRFTRTATDNRVFTYSVYYYIRY